MARKASVRYWASRGGFCCWHNGRQVLLASGPDDSLDGPIYASALKKFALLVCGQTEGLTVGEGIDKYLEWAESHRSESTVHIRQTCLGRLRTSMGERAVSSLSRYDLEKWSDEMGRERGWSEGTKWLTLVSISVWLSWLQDSGLIPTNPVRKLDLPVPGSRGLECVLTAEQEEAVIGAAKGATREFVQALRDTGARPGEISMAEARHYEPAFRALVFQAVPGKGQKRHKTARTGKPRVIYLAGETLATVQRLLIEHPTGKLFRTALRRFKGPHKGHRGPWKPENVREAFKWLRRKTGLESLVAYSFRHTYAVRWLRLGKSVDALAEVMGTSPLMIRRHYGHLADQRDYLRRLADEMAAERGNG